MNWVKKQKISAIEVIQFNKQQCIDIKDLWRALHQTFNSAQSQQVNKSLLEKLLSKQYLLWNLFSRKEFMMAINKYNNSFTPGLDRISWKHLKLVIRDDKCLENIVNLANAYINLEH